MNELPSYIARYPISRERLELVWAAVTAEPQAGVQELAARLRLGLYVVNNALRRLAAQGAITWEPHHPERRQILIPFVAQVAELPRCAPGYEDRQARWRKERLAA